MSFAIAIDKCFDYKERYYNSTMPLGAYYKRELFVGFKTHDLLLPNIIIFIVEYLFIISLAQVKVSATPSPPVCSHKS